jgi:hypothetical protein
MTPLAIPRAPPLPISKYRVLALGGYSIVVTPTPLFLCTPRLGRTSDVQTRLHETSRPLPKSRYRPANTGVDTVQHIPVSRSVTLEALWQSSGRTDQMAANGCSRRIANPMANPWVAPIASFGLLRHGHARLPSACELSVASQQSPVHPSSSSRRVSHSSHTSGSR